MLTWKPDSLDWIRFCKVLLFLAASHRFPGKQEAVKFGHNVDEKKCSGLIWQVSNSRLF